MPRTLLTLVLCLLFAVPLAAAADPPTAAAPAAVLDEVLVTGEQLTVLWLTIPVILVLQTMFNAGIAMMFARFTAASADVTQLVPFLLQTWRYFSGVFFSIAVFTAHKPPWVRDLMWANPATTYMELMRDVMMTSHMAPAKLWLYALAWGVAMLVVGFWVFHRAEESYARG